MIIRLMQFINNFYKDAQENSCHTQGTPELGAYCSFGYFDAFQTSITSKIENRRNDIWNILKDATLEQLDETCSRRNLICGIKDDNKDITFWVEAKNCLFLFITMIRLKNPYENIESLENSVGIINNESDAIAYYSNDHCELVVAKFCNNYKIGVEHVMNLRREMSVLKMYTIFSVREDILANATNCDQINKEERINCRLTSVVKSQAEAEKFIEKLYNLLSNNGQDQEMSVTQYNTFGGSDMLIDIHNVIFAKILECYSTKQKGLLTHFNNDYSEAFYNIETEFLLREGAKKYGADQEISERPECIECNM